MHFSVGPGLHRADGARARPARVRAAPGAPGALHRRGLRARAAARRRARAAPAEPARAHARELVVRDRAGRRARRRGLARRRRGGAVGPGGDAGGADRARRRDVRAARCAPRRARPRARCSASGGSTPSTWRSRPPACSPRWPSTSTRPPRSPCCRSSACSPSSRVSARRGWRASPSSTPPTAARRSCSATWSRPTTATPGEHCRDVVDLAVGGRPRARALRRADAQPRVRRAAARRGQGRRPQGDHQQAGPARRGGVADRPRPHDRGPAHARPRRRVHARGGRDRPRASRALGRRRLPGRARRRRRSRSRRASSPPATPGTR